MHGRKIRRAEVRSPQGDGARLSGQAPVDLRGELTALLQRHGLRPDKRFGQHFLASTKIVEAIVSSVDRSASVLEIGPGIGVITRPLTQRQPHVTAIELDERVLPVLADYAPQAEVIRMDALELDWSERLLQWPSPRSIVSNMPYNITGPLLGKVSESRALIDRAVLMMQREVGERILAQPGQSQRGSLSVVMQAQFDIRRVCHVPPGAFLPPPKVESVVLAFLPRPSSPAEPFTKLVRAGFGQPRKTLWNNISGLGISRTEFESYVASRDMATSVRPHQLTQADWEGLASIVAH